MNKLAKNTVVYIFTGRMADSAYSCTGALHDVLLLLGSYVLQTT